MILRKPYGFLIKHFKFIHLIITSIMVYLMMFSIDVYKYINLCIKDNVNKYDALQYVNYNIYIFMLILVVLLGVIYWLFKYKDKPRNVYVASIVGYIVIGIYFLVVFGYFSELPNNIIDQKVIRAYRDITLMIVAFQSIFTIIMFLRGLGFDVKKFNFGKDIQELNLTQEDGEEIEVSVSFNTEAVARGFRKQRREFGYFFKEYKVIIIGILSILLFTLGYFGYNYIKKEFKVYNQGDMIGYTYNIVIKRSYFNISDGKNYVMVNLDISKYGMEEKFNINNLKLLIGDNEYVANKNICSEFSNLGTCYKRQYINNNMKNYLIVYEVSGLNLDKTYLVYKETYDDKYKVKLNLESYD